MEYKFKGKHVIAEFYGVESTVFDRKDIKEVVEKYCKVSKITCLKTEVFYFENGGYTLFSLLAESHIAIHTYAEYNAVFIDVFTCGSIRPENSLEILEKYYAPKTKNMKILDRGCDIS